MTRLQAQKLSFRSAKCHVSHDENSGFAGRKLWFRRLFRSVSLHKNRLSQHNTLRLKPLHLHAFSAVFPPARIYFSEKRSMRASQEIKVKRKKAKKRTDENKEKTKRRYAPQCTHQSALRQKAHTETAADKCVPFFYVTAIHLINFTYLCKNRDW